MLNQTKPYVTGCVMLMLAIGLGFYFTFAAIQGEYGLFRRAEIIAQNQQLEREYLALQTQVLEMENLTQRMSDTYLDLDLLDQQARAVLGLMRADEIAIR